MNGSLTHPRTISSGVLLRRCFLGAVIRDTPRGVEVTRVVEGSMAERAGLRPGDLLVRFGHDVSTREELVGACRTRAGHGSELHYLRAGSPLRASVEYVPFPEERVPGASVEYGDSEGARTILARPPGADTVVCFLPGIDYASVDYALVEELPAARLLADFAREGLATYRVERPGLGDSPGAPCEGFLDEQHVYRRAIEALPGFRRRVLFGHSVGGMHAPMLADLAHALVVYGASRRRWSECLRASHDRQIRLRGIASKPMSTWPEERATRFHEELDAVDLAGAWDKVRCPWLVVIGEHDWIVGDEEQRELGGDVLGLSDLDHAFTRHASLSASLEAFGRGDYDERIATGCARWIEARGA